MEHEKLNNQETAQLGIGAVISRLKFYFHHPFRLSEGGYFHLPLLSISFGRDGFAFYILGFSIAVSWSNGL